VQGDACHPSRQGGGQEKNNWKKLDGRGGEAQGVADPQNALFLRVSLRNKCLKMFFF
jgi:hypothetical protein